MKFDSDEWRDVRDGKLRDWIGDASAVEFFLLVSSIAETWDDIVDGDQPSVDAVHGAFVAALVGLELNGFYQKHKGFLFPFVLQSVNAYMDSVQMEKGTTSDRTHAYTLRLLTLTLVPMLAFLVGGFPRMRQTSLASWQFFTAHDPIEGWMAELTQQRSEP